MAFIAHTENGAGIAQRLSDHPRAVSVLARQFAATAVPVIVEATEWRKTLSPARQRWEDVPPSSDQALAEGDRICSFGAEPPIVLHACVRCKEFLLEYVGSFGMATSMCVTEKHVIPASLEMAIDQ